MADLSQAYSALQKADAAGDTAGAKTLADYIRSQSGAPPQEKSQNVANATFHNGIDATRDAEIRAANIAASKQEHSPIEDILGMGQGIVSGAGKSLAGIGNAIEHPIDTAGSLIGKIPSAIGAVGNAALHPIDTAQSIAQTVKGMGPQDVGDLIGSSAVGGAAGKALGVLGDVVGPSLKAAGGGKGVSPEIRAMANKGIVTTPGQRGGINSFRSTAEQKLESLAGGQSITNRRGEAVNRWASEKFDDALASAGMPPVPKNKSGRDAIFHTRTQLSNGYSALLPRLQGDLNKVANGSSLGGELAQIRAAGTAKGTGIRPTERARLASIIDQDIIERFNKTGGVADGKTLKSIDDMLDKEIKQYGAGNVSQRKVAEHLKDVKSKLWDMIRRENPQHAADLKKLDTAWSKYQAAALASRIGGKAQGGSFTPNQYLRSIERREKGDKNRFTSGIAPGQKEAESASQILGNNVANSGTPGRQQLIEMLKNPFASAGGLALNAITPVVYSKPVQKWLQNRALKKGGPYQPIGKAAPAGGALFGAIQGQEQPDAPSP